MRYLFIVIAFISLRIQAQSLTISGKITDKTSGEKLIGVTCYDSVSHKAFYSNNEGFFSFTTTKKSAKISFSYVGYVPYQQSFSTSITTEIKLEAGLSLGEARVTSAKNRNFTKIDAATIRKLPSLLGEADVMKSLTFQPGVMGGTEGSAGVFVRGSSPDQNLVLWDEAMLYNINHLGGFFSIFNPTLVKDIQFYKSYLPANYGGRASSVISVTTRDGDNKKLRGEAEIGLLNQNLTLEGPIKKNKSSFIVSGRYSNLGIYGALASVIAPNDFAAISFYDISGKATFSVGKTGSLGVSFFRGSDSYTTTSNYHETLLKNKLGWTNAAYSIRYSVPITQKIFGRFIATQTEYKSQMSYYERQLEANYTSEDIINNRIIDRVAKASIDFFPNHKIDFTVGADIVFHKFLPNYSNSEQNVVIKAKGSLVKSTEIGTYISAKIDFTPRIKIESSIRNSRLTGTEINYKNIEPRVLLSFTSKNKSIFQFAYTNAYQYVHSLSSTGSGFNVELWVPATKMVAPLNVNTISMAYKKSFAKGKINYSSEIYTKTFSNLISYPEGANLVIFQTSDWENSILKNGMGRSIGWENNIDGAFKKLYFNVSYTLSKTERRFAEINNAQWFPFKFDRRHYLTAMGSYKINSKWETSFAFVAQTGQAFTVPIAVSIDKSVLNPRLYYTSINNGRFPFYHRLDIGFSKTKTTKRNNTATWSFGAMNVYNRKNPAYLDVLHQNTSKGLTYDVLPKSIFPIIPYIKYSIKF